MAIDASIYSQIQKPEFESPINAMAKVAQYQNAQNQNALAQYKLNSAQREDNQNTAISNAYKNALGPDGKIDRASLFTKLAADGAGAKIPEYQKTFADQDKTAAETQKTQVQVLQEVNGLVGSAAGALKSNPTPQNAQFLISNLKNKLGPELSTKAGLDNIQIPTDPQEIYQWADTHYLNAQAVDKKLAAETQIKTTQMNNDTSRINNQETNATSRSNNAATVGATIRGQNMTDARSKETIKKDYAINGLNPDGSSTGDVESMAQGIASGKLSPINGFALAKPRGQQIMARVMDINPNYDAGDFAAKNKALTSFSTGQQGNAIRSFAVANDHLDQLNTLVDALDNKNLQVINKVGNAIAAQTGSTAPTNFDAAKDIVGKEVTKAIVGSGGGVEERQELSRQLNNAKTPAQLKGVIGQYHNLMGAQHDALIQQYHNTTGRTDGATKFSYKKDADKAPSSGGIVDFGSLK